MQMKKYLVILLVSTFGFFTIFKVVQYINLRELSSDPNEIMVLNRFYGARIKISSKNDIEFLINHTIENIKHGVSPTSEGEALDAVKIIESRTGSCYDRSLILKKVMLLNDIQITPVFLYYSLSNSRLLPILSKKTMSHNIFEIEFQGNKYIVNTNYRAPKLMNLEEYLHSRINPNFKGFKLFYIKHLDNRNGYFLYPNFLPDIY